MGLKASISSTAGRVRRRVYHEIEVPIKPSPPPSSSSRKCTEHHYLSHVDKFHLEDVCSSLPMHSPHGESIEQVYDGVHDGRIVGSGASAVVRVVTHRETQTQYAVKCIDLRRNMTKKKLERLYNEIQIMAQVQHANIIRLHQVYSSETHLYLVQDLCEGDLFDLLRAQPNRRFTEAQAIQFALQMLSAIKYLHAHFILHRDVKLENFLVTPEGQLKMIDFGTAKHFRAGETHSEGIGTPYVVAPEVIHRCYTEKSDVWAVGVLTYVMLSGETPFGGCCDGASMVAVRNNILQANLCFEESTWKDVSESAKDFVKKLLTVDLYRRPSAKTALRHEWLKEEFKKKQLSPVAITKKPSANARRKILPVSNNPSAAIMFACA